MSHRGRSSPDNDSQPRRRDHRPTLPPIRALFPEELSQGPRPHAPIDHSFSLARLRVSDDDTSHPPPFHRHNSPLPPGSLVAPGSQRQSRSSTPSLSLSMPRGNPFMAPPHSRPHPNSNASYSHFPSSRGHAKGPPADMQPRASTTRAGFYPAPHHSSYDASEVFSTDRPSSNRNAFQYGSTASGSSRMRDTRTFPSVDMSRNPARYTDEPEDLTPTVSNQERSNQDLDAHAMASSRCCGYCGKAFNRPSSLKIHLNSHTGEKPFVCPVEGCGRSFSVLSNMRRHARVHTQTPRKLRETSSDDGSEPPSPSEQSGGPSQYHPKSVSTSSFRGSLSRRNSSASNASSSSSRRSRSPSPAGAPYRPEKRSRR